jgi:hypothetical protein
VGIASTDPNLVQASAPAADANMTGQGRFSLIIEPFC